MMDVLTRSALIMWKSKQNRNCWFRMQFRKMSSSEISAALRPFYFSVHPDLFGQYPSERAINENSLQMLSSFIEKVRADRPANVTTLTFYLKPQGDTTRGNLKSVNIRLNERSIEKTVTSILSSCNLPTTFVDKLKNTAPSDNIKFYKPTGQYKGRYTVENLDDDDDEQQNVVYESKATLDNHLLSSWLQHNIRNAKEKLEQYRPVREDIAKLQNEISSALGIKQLILDCDWNIRHYRGCLASFQALAHHHPTDMATLKGRTVVFGRDTGISFDGHVLLNSGEVRHNWLDFIKNIPKEDAAVHTLPAFEKSVSRVLRDIKVVRRKFQPKRMASQYEINLRRLTTSLSDYQGRYGYPRTWPDSLSEYELVVETDSGPLMVSPTGQFIVPASCPSFLLVNFITDNLNEAKRLNVHYQSHKHIEADLEREVVDQLKLAVISKGDSIAPDLMIHCCSRLIRHQSKFEKMLKGMRLCVTNYYSVMSDGQLCIPWNWKL